MFYIFTFSLVPDCSCHQYDTNRNNIRYSVFGTMEYILLYRRCQLCYYLWRLTTTLLLFMKINDSFVIFYVDCYNLWNCYWLFLRNCVWRLIFTICVIKFVILLIHFIIKCIMVTMLFHIVCVTFSVTYINKCNMNIHKRWWGRQSKWHNDWLRYPLYKWPHFDA